jgi:NitT/TauT family transport system ATP-binding protein
MNTSVPFPSPPAAEPAPGPVLLNAENVGLTFGTGQSRHVVLEKVNLSLHEGEIVGLLGRSGCGKSTLLRLLSGLMSPTHGKVTYEGQPVNGPTSGIAMVFQTFALFPWLTVEGNVRLGLEARGEDPKNAEHKARAAIDLIGLDGYEHAFPRELSGGMRQRIGFSRALVTDPKILLMDEAFSALDVLTSHTLQSDLLHLWQSKKTALRTILLVTHNIEEAATLCDRVLLLRANPGKITHELPVNLRHPRDRNSPEFLTRVDFLYRLMMGGASGNLRPDHVLQSLTAELPDTTASSVRAVLIALGNPPFHGKADAARLAETVGGDISDFVPACDAAEILGLIQLDNAGQMELTAVGKQLAAAETPKAKELFGQRMLAAVPLAAHVSQVLQARPGFRAPRRRFLDEMEDTITCEQAEVVLHRLTKWARYGELFAYDSTRDEYFLEK